MKPTWGTQDGRVNLYLADCLEVLPTLSGIDAVVTDPPYGISLADNSQGGKHGRPRPAFAMTIAGDENQEVGHSMLEWCLGMSLPTVVFASPRKPWEGKWSSLLVWDKGPAVGGGGDTSRCWKQSWELIQVARIERLRFGRDSSVLKHWVTPDLSQIHPACKPVSLMNYLIQQISDHGSCILDPFMGSGTTGVACIRAGRRFIGIEKEPKYFDIAVKRIQEELTRTPLFDTIEKTQQPTMFGEPS